MLKKLRVCLSFIACLFLLFSLYTPAGAANGAESETGVESTLIGSRLGISPNMLYTDRTSTTISIGAYGEATSYGCIIGCYGTDEVWIYLYLQRYVNGAWQNFNSWSKTYASFYGILEEYDVVPHGYYYRVKGSYYAWSGGNYEHTYGYSATVYY
jgi:hypothetical protein